ASTASSNSGPLPPLPSSRFFAIFAPAVAKVYIVSFRSNDDRRPSEFIVVADNMKSAINMAWEHGGADFQSRFDKATGTSTGDDNERERLGKPRGATAVSNNRSRCCTL